MSVSQEDLPLGAACSGLLLLLFVFIRSSHQLLLVVARNGSEEGFPFLFETVLMIPLALQTALYAAQACKDFGFRQGLSAIKSAAPRMGPCAFYSIFIVLTNTLETYCLQFIPASLYIVLKQLAMVVIAIGEVIFLAAKPSGVAWLLIFSQALCVGLFQVSSVESKSADNAAMDSVSFFTLGVLTCVISSFTGGLGNTLQQRFFQSQAKGVPLSVKLFYQHLFALVFLVIMFVARPDNRNRLATEGFFGGWNRWAVIVCLNKWCRFYSASAISAYISALAGAFRRCSKCCPHWLTRVCSAWPCVLPAGIRLNGHGLCDCCVVYPGANESPEW